MADVMLIDKIGTRKDTLEPWIKWVITILLVLGGALALHFERVGSKRRLHVVTFLESIDDSAVVYVNGQPADNRDAVVTQLMTLRKRKPHGSLPVEKLQVMITDGETHLKLVLGTDSEVNTEYWVYLVDEFKASKEFPSSNDIIGTIDRNESIQGWL